MSMTHKKHRTNGRKGSPRPHISKNDGYSDPMDYTTPAVNPETRNHGMYPSSPTNYSLTKKPSSYIAKLKDPADLVAAREASVRNRVSHMSDEELEREAKRLMGLGTTYANAVSTYQFAREASLKGVLSLKRKIDSRHSERVSPLEILDEAFNTMVVYDEYKRRTSEISL